MPPHSDGTLSLSQGRPHGEQLQGVLHSLYWCSLEKLGVGVGKGRYVYYKILGYGNPMTGSYKLETQESSWCGLKPERWGTDGVSASLYLKA